MIETMRFSDTPLWWRLLVLALTALVGFAIYWATAWAVSQMSTSLVTVIFVVMFVGGLVGTIYTTRRDKRRLANRQEVARQPERRRK